MSEDLAHAFCRPFQCFFAFAEGESHMIFRVLPDGVSLKKADGGIVATPTCFD